MTARDILLAWVSSGGFAAIHNGKSTDEEIVEDLLTFLASQGWEITPGDHDGTD